VLIGLPEGTRSTIRFPVDFEVLRQYLQAILSEYAPLFVSHANMGYYAWRLLLKYRLLDHGRSGIRTLALCSNVSDSLEMQHDESLARIGQS
jgi:hypothetical protein